jgi:hypothetical protein
MKQVSRLLVLTAALFSSAASSAEFQLKGQTLGADEKTACGLAPVTNRQDSLNATGVTDVNFPATGCELAFDTVAGIRLCEPAKLLFWKGHLIRLLVRFESVELNDAAALRAAFMDLYGKPSTRRSAPFRTDTWRSERHSLELEWTDGTPANVGAYLTDSVNWAEYQKVEVLATKAIQALEKKRRSNDLRN